MDIPSQNRDHQYSRRKFINKRTQKKTNLFNSLLQLLQNQ